MAAKNCVVFLGKTLYSHNASLDLGVKWVPANLMLDGQASDLGRSRSTLSLFRISFGLLGDFARMQTFFIVL